MIDKFFLVAQHVFFSRADPAQSDCEKGVLDGESPVKGSPVHQLSCSGAMMSRDSDRDLALGHGIGNQTPTEVGVCVTDSPVAQHDWVVAYDDLYRRSDGNCYDGYFRLSDF